MTYNSSLVLNLLKKNFGKEFTKNEIATTLGISLPAVTGSVRGLVANKYATERIEEIELEPAVEANPEAGIRGRKAKIKTIRHVQLTEAGLAYDPEAEEAAKKA